MTTDPTANLTELEIRSAPSDASSTAVDELATLYAAAENQRDEARAERNGAYRERAYLLALLAALHPSVIAPAPDVDEPGWWIAYLRIGGRQASWHISPRDADLFAHVERVPADDRRAQWDGHTTAEKYAHIAKHSARLYAEARGRVETPLMVNKAQPAATEPDCDRCDGSGLDPDRCTERQNPDGTSRYHAEPCSDCQQADEAPPCDGCGHPEHPAHGCPVTLYGERCACDEPVTAEEQPAASPCSDPPCNTDGNGEPCDRHEEEQAHADGLHEDCGVTCEVQYPTEHLRNFVIAKGYPGTAGMLDELLRRAAAAPAGTEAQR